DPPSLSLEILQGLPRNWSKNRPRLRLPLGIAVWNLLPAHARLPDPAFTDLLGAVLALNVRAAQRLQRTQAAGVAPFPTQIILDANRSLQDEVHSPRASLAVCVQARFEELSKRVNPERWVVCDWFWSYITPFDPPVPEGDGRWSRRTQAGLILPGGPRKSI